MSVLMDMYFPFAEGPGAAVMMDRWRPMAKLWSPTGVVRGIGDQLGAVGWSIEEQTMAVGSGACWIDGFYGELAGPRWIGCPTNTGLVVARLNPWENSQHITLEFKQGPGHGETEDPNNEWELALTRMNGPGDWVDVRRFVPELPPPPAIEEMPAWAPRAWVANNAGPATEVHVSGNTVELVHLGPLGADIGFVPGRNYRFTAQLGANAVDGMTGAGAQQIFFLVRDDAGERKRVLLGQGSWSAGTMVPPIAQSFIVRPTWSNATAVIGATTASTNSTLRIRPWSFALDCFDVGGAR